MLLVHFSNKKNNVQQDCYITIESVLRSTCINKGFQQLNICVENAILR